MGTDIAEAATWILSGNCVAIPTETVYGLAANALNVEAVANIFRIKGRPDFDPLIVHVADAAQAWTYAQRIPKAAYALAEAFWPGPLTLVLPKTSDIPNAVTSGLASVGLRVPKHPMTLDLLRLLEIPLAAPSANPFGYVSPSRAQHVADQLGHRIPYILDGGACQIGIESTIVGFQDEKPVILRPGMLSAQAIEKVCGYLPEVRLSSSRPEAPGMLMSHYAPHTPLLRYQGQVPEPNSGLLSWRKLYVNELFTNVYWLSEQGDPYEAARHVYHALRLLDQAGLAQIYVAFPPESEDWMAIRDRLNRAVHSNLA